MVDRGPTRRRRRPRPAPTGRLVEALARMVRDIAGDLGAFGPGLDDAKGRAEDVRRRLWGAFHELLAARRTLLRMRVPHVEAQRRRILGGSSGTAKAAKIHIGGGSFRLEGWINVDMAPADVAVDVRWGLPFAARSASFVFCSHLLEHLEYPRDAQALLGEIRRVLRPGGVARLVVPDMEAYAAAYVRGDRAFFRARAAAWPDSRRARTLLEAMLLYAGAGGQPDDFFGHKFGYDFDTLKHALGAAGFARIRRSDYMASAHAELRVDDASHVAGARHRGASYSLFVEATRSTGRRSAPLRR